MELEHSRIVHESIMRRKTCKFRSCSCSFACES